MKYIHLIVNSCKSCPYCEVINECVYYCKLGVLGHTFIGIDYRDIVYDGKIPKWCELPDVYDQEDDGEID